MCVRVFVGVRVGVSFMQATGVLRTGGRWFRRQAIASEHVHFRCRHAAAADLVCLQARADIQRGGCFRKMTEGNTGIDQCAQQHVAADACKALQISNTHRG